MLLPEDDLNLACLLKSPLLGLGEDELFELAWDRGEASLLERLRALAETRPARFAVAYARLARLAAARRLHAAVRVLRLGAGRRWRPATPAGPARPRRGRADRGLPRPGPGLRAGPSGVDGRLPALAVPRHGRAEARPREGTRRGARRPPCTAPRGSRRRSCSWPMPGRAGAPARGRLLWSDPALDGTGAELPLWRAAKAERDGLTEAIVAARGRGASSRSAAACSTSR